MGELHTWHHRAHDNVVPVISLLYKISCTFFSPSHPRHIKFTVDYLPSNALAGGCGQTARRYSKAVWCWPLPAESFWAVVVGLVTFQLPVTLFMKRSST